MLSWRLQAERRQVRLALMLLLVVGLATAHLAAGGHNDVIEGSDNILFFTGPGLWVCEQLGMRPWSTGFVIHYDLPLLVHQFVLNLSIWSVAGTLVDRLIAHGFHRLRRRRSPVRG